MQNTEMGKSKERPNERIALAHANKQKEDRKIS
jgi:hypothetical protein